MKVYEEGSKTLLKIADESMQPYAHVGDVIEIDTEGEIGEGTPVIVQMQGEDILRRIYQTGGGYKLVADNSEYPPYSMRMRPHIIGVASRIYVPIENILTKEYKRYDGRRENG